MERKVGIGVESEVGTCHSTVDNINAEFIPSSGYAASTQRSTFHQMAHSFYVLFKVRPKYTSQWIS